MYKYKDKKAILIVNVACSCGYTSNHYKELVDLYAKYQYSLLISLEIKV